MLRDPGTPVVGIGSGSIAAIVVWGLALAGIAVDWEVGVAMAGAAGSVGLLVWRHGISGIGARLWRGEKR